MSNPIGTRQIRKTKISEAITVRVLLNDSLGRLYVEFASEDRKVVWQKSFQDTYAGRKEAEEFERSVKSIEELREHFGIKGDQK